MSVIEQAKLESDTLRKAKLFKHILLSADVTQEQAMKLIGTNDSNLVSNVLKQVSSKTNKKKLKKKMGFFRLDNGTLFFYLSLPLQ